MRYLALATDYDGTLAHDGRVDEATVKALQRARDSGRHLMLVTGRQLWHLLEAFPHVDLFDWIVAENGALLYHPADKREHTLAPGPPEELVKLLREKGVSPLGVGRVIVDTREPNETIVLEAIRTLGLEHQVIFNKGAVMILPPGINKAAGLEAALKEMALSPHNVVGVGDAENDHAFLQVCECAAAVGNALPSLKEQADLVLGETHGAAVTQLIDRLIKTDLEEVTPQLNRHDLLLGAKEGEEVKLPAHGVNLLIAGPPHSGKSSFVTGILEQMAKHCYQFCALDPEGDYEMVDCAVTLGNTKQRPSVDEILEVLKDPRENVVVNLLAIGLEDRPAFFQKLLPRLQETRTQTGRPHWIVVDEAHHLLPARWEPAATMVPQDLINMVIISVQPREVAPAVLRPVDLVAAVGDRTDETIGDFVQSTGRSTPALPRVTLEKGQALAWSPSVPDQTFTFEEVQSSTEHQRHIRKYARGDMGDESFYFRGPEGKLNLRAQNLMLFLQIADGVDDNTWMYHLRRGEYSRWFRDMLKDKDLAEEAERVERQRDISAKDSKAKIREMVEKRYTAPAGAP